MGGWGSELDRSGIMQPNPGWGVIVNIKTIPSITIAETIICLCFAEGAMLDRRTTLGNFVELMKSRNSGIRISDILQWESGVGEELSRYDALLWWELKTFNLKGEDLRTGEVGINLDGPDWRNGRFFLTI